MRWRRLRSLDPVTLKAFAATIRLGSIARAAGEIGIAASAVSRRIADMEAALGTPLLERWARGVRPTAAGEAVLRYARGTLSLVDRLNAELDDLDAGRSGELTIAAVTSAILGRLPDDLAELRSERPRLRVRVIELSSSTAGVRLVRDGEADLGIVADNQDADDLSSAFYAHDPIRVVVALGHPLLAARDAGGSVSFAQTLEHDVITLGGGAAIAAIVSAAADIDEHGLRRTQEVNTFGALIRLVEGGLGIGFLRESSARFLGGSRAVEVLSLRERWAERDLVLISRRDGTATPSAAAFLKIAAMTQKTE